MIKQIFSAFITFSNSAQEAGNGDGVSIPETANSIWVLRKERECRGAGRASGRCELRMHGSWFSKHEGKGEMAVWRGASGSSGRGYEELSEHLIVEGSGMSDDVNSKCG